MDEIQKIEESGVIYDIADLAARAAIEELRALIPSGGGGEVPTGTVLAFAGATAPDGFLLCDGTSYNVADYPALYAVIGNLYGGDTETFQTPNLINRFVQGSATPGTVKNAGLPNITGSGAGFSAKNGTTQCPKASGAFAQITSSGYASFTLAGSFPLYANNFNARRSSSIYGNSNTVQPPALTMQYIIKA